LGLFGLLGPRRARAIAQILAMLIGAVVALSIQAMAVLPTDLRRTILDALNIAEGASIADGRALLPIAAARGEPTALALMVLPAIVLLVLVLRWLGPVFTASVATAAGADLKPRTTTRAPAPVSFTADPGASIRAKELKLLARDPWIAGQLVLQMVYTLPVALILWRSGIGAIVPAVAVTPSLVIIAAQMSGSLAWIAISGEDAPEFMATAPVSRASAEIRKLQVIGIVVGGALALPMLLLAWASPLAGLIALLACMAAGISCALINLWHPTDGRRRSFMRRHAQSKLVSLFEHALLLLWAIAAAIAQMGTVVAVVPALLALGLLWLARRMLVKRTRRQTPTRAVAATGGIPQPAV
jgi:ABC-2 type transport system permease protein